MYQTSDCYTLGLGRVCKANKIFFTEVPCTSKIYLAPNSSALHFTVLPYTSSKCSTVYQPSLYSRSVPSLCPVSLFNGAVNGQLGPNHCCGHNISSWWIQWVQVTFYQLAQGYLRPSGHWTLLEQLKERIHRVCRLQRQKYGIKIPAYRKLLNLSKCADNSQIRKIMKKKKK